MLRYGTWLTQAQDQSHWPHWLLEHCNHVSRWFSVCLRWQGCQSYVVGPSTLCASLPTVTGCAPLPAHPLRSGILKARTWLKSSNQRSLETLPRLDHPNVCLWLGQLMAKLFLLVTLTTKSVSGRFPSPLPAKQIRTIIGHCAMRYFDDMLKVISSLLCW